MNNPFVTNGYAGEHYFCDRVTETQSLTELLCNENNVALISPRRLGKTDLIKHCFAQDEIKNQYYAFVVDVYATTSLREFVNALGKSIIEALKPKGKRIMQRFVDVVASLRADVTFDVFGQPSWGVGVGTMKDPETSLDEIFKFLEQADHHCIVAIDEFQQIASYSDAPNIEAQLRTHIQNCRNANFIFAGSQRHLLNEMFASPSRPFYQSVTIMNLQPLALEAYRDFAVNLFDEAGKTLPGEVVDEVYHRFHGVTAYMQRIMNTLFLRTGRGEECDLLAIDEAVDYHLNMANDTYEALLRQLPASQSKTFVAIAMEGKVKGVTSGEFVRKYNLQSVSSVNSAVKGLLAKDLLTEDKGYYMAYDAFFALWIRRNVTH